MVKAALYTAGLIFALNAIVQIARLITGFEWVAAGVSVPVWIHAPGALIAIGLALWMYIAARRSSGRRAT